jgi:hypothetical protein
MRLEIQVEEIVFHMKETKDWNLQQQLENAHLKEHPRNNRITWKIMVWFCTYQITSNILYNLINK